MYTVTLPQWMRANLFLFPTLYVLVSLFNNPVQVYSERTVPSRSSSTTHSGKTPKTENSNLHGFELHRPLRKGTKLLIQVIKTIKNRYTEIVTRNLVKVRIPRPCSPIWDKWNDSSGQTPCPCPTCPTKIWRPPSPCPTCLTKIWRPSSPCPTCPTFSNLSQLVPFGCITCPFPTLFSELFFWVSQCHSIFRKTLLNEKFASKYYHVGEGIIRVGITNKFSRKDRRQPWPYIRTHRYILFTV